MLKVTRGWMWTLWKIHMQSKSFLLLPQKVFYLTSVPGFGGGISIYRSVIVFMKKMTLGIVWCCPTTIVGRCNIANNVVLKRWRKSWMNNPRCSALGSSLQSHISMCLWCKVPRKTLQFRTGWQNLWKGVQIYLILVMLHCGRQSPHVQHQYAKFLVLFSNWWWDRLSTQQTWHLPHLD